MTTLLEQLHERQAEERAKAGETYKALLLRRAKPRPGDVARLSEVMNVLGRSEADLPGDLGLVECLVGHEHATARQAELQKARADARATLNTVGQEAEQARRALEDKLKGRFDKAGAACQAAIAAVSANQQAIDQAAHAVRYAWPALIEGVPIEVYRERHRVRREHTPPGKSRGAVLAACTAELGGARITGGSRRYVDHCLRTYALQPLTDVEWEGLMVAINERRQRSGVKALQHESKREAPPAVHGRNAPVAHGLL